jgi:LmbE family N-acetylglucosaminyl deacetylase
MISSFMAFHGVAQCFGRGDRWFGGVTCTDGRGSSRNGAYADLSPEELGDLRRREQEEAAKIGRYGSMIQLGFPSAQVVDPNSHTLSDSLRSIVSAAKPEVIYTHNPADKHATHIGVFAALLRALSKPAGPGRPAKLIGCEVWRDLDWLCDGDKIRMDVTGQEELSTKTQRGLCFADSWRQALRSRRGW